MTETAKERVLRQYGAVGDAYVRSKGHAGGNDLARLVELVHPQTHERLLDIATGGGHVARSFAPLVAEVVASDLTPSMLVEAEKYFRELGLTNVTVAEADAEELPFADASFDIVTCRIAPHHFPHPERFVAEVARVLRPGGRFGLIDSIAPLGELGEIYNRYELARDPSHVRSLSTEAWTDLIARCGLHLRAIEHFPKRHDFIDWTDRARVPADRRDAVARILLDAGPDAVEAFHLEIADGRLIGFTDDKGLFLAERP
ncbi:MAG: methyltransferase domain-containing protein [Thermomicrobiales bacterium]|nr:methyltransferase domain-containing protein [Thermomicrobiales bacterium]